MFHNYQRIIYMWYINLTGHNNLSLQRFNYSSSEEIKQPKQMSIPVIGPVIVSRF